MSVLVLCREEMTRTAYLIANYTPPGVLRAHLARKFASFLQGVPTREVRSREHTRNHAQHMPHTESPHELCASMRSNLHCFLPHRLLSQ